jgi:hypothetical protein
VFAIPPAIAIIATCTDNHHYPNWRKDGACRGLDPDLFHGTVHQMHQAQHVCAGCPVAEVCLWTALVHEDPVYRCGVFVGLLPHQRSQRCQLAALCPPARAAELLALELAWWKS